MARWRQASWKALLAESGLLHSSANAPTTIWHTLRYSTRDIYVTAHYSAPLMPQLEDLVAESDVAYLQTAVNALAKMTAGTCMWVKERG